MLGVGQRIPEFHVKATVSSRLKDAFVTVSNTSFPSKWLVLFFWPKDFTFVCPTEIVAFAHMNQEFQSRDAQLLGASTDSEFVHLAWRERDKALTHLPFPMLADVKRELSQALGILDPQEGVAQRATYIIDPAGIIRFVMVTDLSVGRNVTEVLRVLDALQTGGLTPCNWQKGSDTIQL